MYLDPQVIRQQIAQLRLKYPELEEDPEALELSLESETDAVALLDQLIAREAETNSLITGLDIHIAEMKQRSNRLADRQAALRELMFSIMQAAGLPKVERPTATLSIRKGSMKVIVPDDEAVPDRFCEFKRSVSKTKLKEALEAGETLNYAVLERGPEILAVRTK